MTNRCFLLLLPCLLACVPFPSDELDGGPLTEADAGVPADPCAPRVLDELPAPRLSSPRLALNASSVYFHVGDRTWRFVPRDGSAPPWSTTFATDDALLITDDALYLDDGRRRYALDGEDLGHLGPPLGTVTANPTARPRARDATNIYGIVHRGVWKRRIADGRLTVFSQLDGVSDLSLLAVDGTSLFVGHSELRGLERMDKDGKNRTLIVPTADVSKGLAVTSDKVWWISSTGDVFRADKDGGNEERVWTPGARHLHGDPLHVDDAGIYYPVRNFIRFVANDGTTEDIAVDLVPEGRALDVAVDDKYVYWLQTLNTTQRNPPARLYRACKPAGTTVDPLTIGGADDTYPVPTYEQLATSAWPTHLTVADGHVYWIEQDTGNTVQRVSIEGGDAQQVLAQPRTRSVVVAAGNLFFTQYGTLPFSFLDGLVGMVAAGSTTITHVIEDQNYPHALTTHAGQVFWSTLDGLWSVPSVGSPVRKVADTGARFLAVDETGIYFSELDDLQHVGHEDGSQPTVLLAPEVTGPVGPNRIRSLAIDDTHVYFLSMQNLDGGPTTLKAIPKSGGEPRVIGEAGTPEEFIGLHAVATDGSKVYWVSKDLDAIMRAPVDGSAEPEAFVPDLLHAYGVVVAGEYVYFTDAKDGIVGRKHK